MKFAPRIFFIVLLISPSIFAGEIEEQNKALARRFYEEVWFKRNMAAVDELVVENYIVHDTGERKNAMEKAAEQKAIAEFFWERGQMTGSIDYQIAEGDLVATRWQWHFEPSVWWMKLIGGNEHIPIINVFRFRDGKIVEIWNHRHDIDTAKANVILIKGVLIGLAPSLVLLITFFVFWRKYRRYQQGPNPERHYPG